MRTHEVALADYILTLPVNPAFASLNLAQAVIIVAYEWFKLASGGALPFSMPRKSAPATREQLLAFFGDLERELEKVEFFRPAEKRETMSINLRNIFHRMTPTQQDIRTLHGVFLAIAEGRKGPAKGGVLDGEEAQLLRALLAEHSRAGGRGTRSGARTVAAVAPQSDRCRARAVGRSHQGPALCRLGFKRQTPVGRHIIDLVSFQLRMVIDIVPDEEEASAAVQRAEKRAWLTERDYQVMEVRANEIAADVAQVLERIAAAISQP